VKPVERKKYVASDDELCLTIPLRRQRSEGIVARNVGVQDVDPMLAHKTRKFESAANIKSVAQAQCEDILRGQLGQFVAERRARGKRDKDFMTTCGKRLREVGEMSFAAAERTRRADV
jgi:hypothetical protein